MKLLSKQYDLLRGSRSVLLNYCSRIPLADAKSSIKSFNDKSIVDMLIHIANVYMHWIGNYALQRQLPYYDAHAMAEFNQVQTAYYDVDNLMQDFILKYEQLPETELSRLLPTGNTRLDTTALTLFTHVLTHECHHKGQILSMGRLLGHIPVDTDIIRF